MLPGLQVRVFDCYIAGNGQVLGGMTVPMPGEAAWVQLDGRETWSQGRVTSLAHKFAPGR